MKYLLSLGVLFITLILPLPSNSIDWPGCSVENENCIPNLILNNSFEEGDYSPTETPTSWGKDAWRFSSAIFTWDDTQARIGDKSVKIDAPVTNDARWIQTVDVESNSWYSLSGWIKTENVATSPGASLSLLGPRHWEHSTGVFGSQDWTPNSLLFSSDDDIQIIIGARLGATGGDTTGTAWFDDLQLKRLVPMDPAPSWKILILIYQNTDFQMTDGEGIFHHYVASMTQDEMDRATEAATAFVETDIPALTSGNMIPEITVRYPDHALTQLSPVGSGWWPSKIDTASDRDPRFDSVIVIWDTRATDTETGEDTWIGFADGLAAHTGTGQTYVSMQIDAAIARGHRNVFKHEWGHSILFHFDAMGITPKPTVGNHAEPKQYVNCETGEFYVWVDENAQNPNIPNSIYNNESGFTHDYYSGTTATAEQPEICLGITSDAWAMGGPVSNSANIAALPDAIDVDIKVKLGNSHNVINPRKRGKIWVAILSDDDPDLPFYPASQIDVSSVEFGPDGAQAKRHKERDINDDGIDDLLLKFKLSQTGIACGDSEVTLTGETFDGQLLTGTDSIQTVGCRKKSRHDDDVYKERNRKRHDYVHRN
ncbi:hypothetical protein [Moritella sp. Urea-trap-13]|uniref:hypothetical protein n=1 Tax=Moritella sp. Urea-trap-13 TaxID=2058327 RepID=UPI000C32FFE3|nr:hypothetical protein [Moritella sp. Urea-trap-13]PKH06836.1 hypothetical protein CXF93_13185 [Moritella sp. Urea-trap-13]